MSLVAFCPFVVVIISEDCFTAYLSEMQAVIPSTRIFCIVRLSDGYVNDIALVDILPIFNGRVRRYLSLRNSICSRKNLWTRQHR